ncbi:MAG: glycerate 2-kinase [Solirubrobacteraceae bacterium]|jgi:glycerate kinase|nr:glycerate 2-kinase [Solirubrobacteraceae bacterium]
MIAQPPVLVAPDSFGGELRAPVVAAAIARGLERAGVTPLPELCPVSSGGRGTIEALLPALGGTTGDGFALIEDGGTAIVELDPSASLTAARLAGAAASGAEVVILAAAAGAGAGSDAGSESGVGDHGADTGEHHGARLLGALAEHGGLGAAALVVLCDARDPGPLAVRLHDEGGARLVAGAPFVLEALGFDVRMRAARAVIVGERRLERATLRGRVTGEIAVRARQSGVPCHAVAGTDAIDRFDARILDLQAILEATTVAELEAAGEALAAYL